MHRIVTTIKNEEFCQAARCLCVVTIFERKKLLLQKCKIVDSLKGGQAKAYSGDSCRKRSRQMLSVPGVPVPAASSAARSCPQAASMSCPLLLRTMAVMFLFHSMRSKARSDSGEGGA